MLMPVPNETILQLAKLAGLNLPACKIENLTSDLAAIVEYFSACDDSTAARDTDQAATVSREKASRQDSRESSIEIKEPLNNASQTKDQFFVVPRVIE